MPESQAPPPRSSKRPRHGHLPAPTLPDDVIVEQILTRVPAAADIRFRAVCRAWHAALTSDHFVQAHRSLRSGAHHQPEIVFFAPRPVAGGLATTSFYTCKLKVAGQHDEPATACELVTVEDLRASNLVLSGTRPCHGLTLLYQPSTSEYHVCNLSTGDHVALPRCAWANRVIRYGPYVLSSTGIGFDAAAGEHKVVRLYEGWDREQHCEVYGLRSGGGWWRSCAGQVPPHAAKGLDGRPPVFLDGCFYWHINTLRNFQGTEALRFSTPEPILSLSVDTEQFGWVPPPEERAHYSFHLAELDGSLCVAVDLRLTFEEYELWTRPTVSGSSSGSQVSWSLRCRLSLASLPRPMRDDLGRGNRMLPLASSFGGRILLATNCNEVFSYDPDGNSVERIFAMQEFVDDLVTVKPELLLNISLHEESITGVRRRRSTTGGDATQLKMKLGSTTVARRQGAAYQHRNDFRITPQLLHTLIGIAAEQYLPH